MSHTRHELVQLEVPALVLEKASLGTPLRSAQSRHQRNVQLIRTMRDAT